MTPAQTTREPRMCPGLPNHAYDGPCGHEPEQGDRYCASYRAEFDNTGDGDPNYPGGIGCEWCDALFATAASADEHVCANFPADHEPTGGVYNEDAILYAVGLNFQDHNPMGDPLYDDTLAKELIVATTSNALAQASMNDAPHVRPAEIAKRVRHALVTIYYGMEQ